MKAAIPMARRMFIGGSLASDPRIMAEKYEKGHFDTGMMENTRRREHQHKPDDGQVLLRRRRSPSWIC